MDFSSQKLFSSERSFCIEQVLQMMDKNGPLCRSIRGFEPRSQQKEMLRNILEAFNKDQIALIEAGTGTGKSMAYLIPSILWAMHTGERILISTNTITLQEQLLHKDIPALCKALNISINAVLVKGMGNYICKRKMDETLEERLLLTTQEREELEYVSAWEERANDGSKASLPKTLSPAMWDKISAERDTCNTNDCPYFQDCHFFKARKIAAEAQILIANHHLLFADLAVRAETDNYSGPAILPLYGRIILDEAHHIEDIATEYFAQELSWMELLRTLARIATEKQTKVQGKLPLLKQKIEESFARSLTKEVSNILGRINLDFPSLRKEVLTASAEAFQAMHRFVPAGEEAAMAEQKLRMLPQFHQQAEWIAEVLPKAKHLIDVTQRYAQALKSLEYDLQNIDNDKFQEQSKGIRFDLTALTTRLYTSAMLLDQFVSSQPPPNKVRWIETQILKTMTNVNLVDAELDVSEALVEFLFKPFHSVILCSATLTTNKQFTYAKQRLGLTEEKLPKKAVTENRYESPFDYQKQALLVIPSDMPPPADPNFLPAAVETIWQMVQISRGAAFVLFTSYSMLKDFYEQLAPTMKEHRFTLLKQGDDNRQALLDKFKDTERAVLFGTDSFWEGVDVAGEALRCVIIVKLPFKVPTEPIVQARTEALIAKGANPFFEYALPGAIVKFKQGAGRLIRNKADRGCIVCLDSRILSKSYGKQFINSLPPCQQLCAPRGEIAGAVKAFYRKTHYLTFQS